MSQLFTVIKEWNFEKLAEMLLLPTSESLPLHPSSFLVSDPETEKVLKESDLSRTRTI